MSSTLTLPQAPTQINGGSTTGVGITSKGDSADNGSGGSESLCVGGAAAKSLGSGGLPCRGTVLLLDVLKVSPLRSLQTLQCLQGRATF